MFAKLGLAGETNPVLFACIRESVAAPLLCALAYWMEGPALPSGKRHFLMFVCLGAALFGEYIAFQACFLALQASAVIAIADYFSLCDTILCLIYSLVSARQPRFLHHRSQGLQRHYCLGMAALTAHHHHCAGSAARSVSGFTRTLYLGAIAFILIALVQNPPEALTAPSLFEQLAISLFSFPYGTAVIV